MLYGSFEHVLDEKNRVAIPAPFREGAMEKRYGKGFFITRGTERCLFLFTPVHWEEFVSNILKLPFSAERRRMERTILSPARKVECDPQGRIVIPQELKEFAGLERMVVLTGLGNRVEVWNTARWKPMDEENVTNYDRLVDKLLGGAAS
jgi:MraZ protein